MKWFESKTRKELKELKSEVDALRAELSRQTEVRVGEWPRNSCGWHDPQGWHDPRPVISLKDVVLLLTDRLKLEIKQTPAVSARTVIERKPKAANWYQS